LESTSLSQSTLILETRVKFDESSAKQTELTDLVKELNRVVKEQREKIDHLCRFHNDAALTFETRIGIAKEQAERLEQAEAELEILIAKKVELEAELQEVKIEFEQDMNKETARYEASNETLQMERDVVKKRLDMEVASLTDVYLFIAN
jgi:predicted component of type VI protein secretion system